jgi:hypothetical protein
MSIPLNVMRAEIRRWKNRMQEFMRRCARHTSWVLEVEEVKVNPTSECEDHRNVPHLARDSLLSISVRHEVGLLWLSTIAAITLSNT